jgi:CBS domain-containing protein
LLPKIVKLKGVFTVKLKDIMTTDVLVVPPERIVREVARQMEQHNIGAIPVCDGDRILGMVTDRDICLKVVAQGKDPDTCKAREVMSVPIVWCYEDTDVEEAIRLMETRQIRRLIVVDANKKLAGVVALGDVAVRANERIAGEALERISEATHPMH